VIGLARGSGHADEPPPDAPAVAAIVNDEPILVSEVERELKRVLGARPVAEQARRRLQAKTLDQLIRRRLILQSLQSSGQGASATEIDLAMGQLRKQLQQRELTLEEHLQQQGLSEAELRRVLEWQVGWQRFLARYLTDANLQAYFDRHRRDFDGTRLRVAHILIKPPGIDSSEAIAALRRLREEITNGTISFEEAARQHSAAPTAATGGDIGFIARREPMPESFSRAAFALDEGELSEPVVSPFGVHLIRCLAIEPGQKGWADVRDELTAAVTAYLFAWSSDRQLPQARIEFTGVTPHFLPSGEQLAPSSP